MGFVNKIEKWVSEDILKQDEDDEDGLNSTLFLLGFIAWWLVISLCILFCCYHCFLMTCVSQIQAYRLERRVDRKKVRRAIRHSINRHEKRSESPPGDDVQTAAVKTTMAVKGTTRGDRCADGSQLVEIISSYTSIQPDSGDNLPTDDDGNYSTTWRSLSEEEEKTNGDGDIESRRS